MNEYMASVPLGVLKRPGHKTVPTSGDGALLSSHMNFVTSDHQNMSPEMCGRRLQEVTDAVRDSLSRRVKECGESLYDRRQPKHKRVLAPASPLFVKGNHSGTEVI